jgi:hypothetical protein
MTGETAGRLPVAPNYYYYYYYYSQDYLRVLHSKLDWT